VSITPANATSPIGSAEAIMLLRQLGVSVHRATLLRWADQGRVKPALKMPGRNGAYLFERAEIQRLAGDCLARERITKAAS